MGLFNRSKKPKELIRHRAMALVFCLGSDPYQICRQVEELFHLEHTGDRNELTLQQEDMEISMLACSSNDEGENGEYAKKQLQGVAGYVYQSKTDAIEIKRALFYHLRQCKALLFVSYAFNSSGPEETARKREQIMAPILDITEKLQGVATFDDGTSLLDGRGRVILDKDGKSDLDWYMPGGLGQKRAPGGHGAAGPVHGSAAGQAYLRHPLAPPPGRERGGPGPYSRGGLRPGGGPADRVPLL